MTETTIAKEKICQWFIKRFTDILLEKEREGRFKESFAEELKRLGVIIISETETPDVRVWLESLDEKTMR